VSPSGLDGSLGGAETVTEKDGPAAVADDGPPRNVDTRLNPGAFLIGASWDGARMGLALPAVPGLDGDHGFGEVGDARFVPPPPPPMRGPILFVRNNTFRRDSVPGITPPPPPAWSGAIPNAEGGLDAFLFRNDCNPAG